MIDLLSGVFQAAEYIAKVQSTPDPASDCKFHTDKGCAHVDGFLCEMQTCDILANHIKTLKEKDNA